MSSTLKLPRPGTRTRALYDLLARTEFGVRWSVAQAEYCRDLPGLPALTGARYKRSGMEVSRLLRKFADRVSGDSYGRNLYILKPIYRSLLTAPRPLAVLAQKEEEIKRETDRGGARRTSLKPSDLKPGDKIRCTDPEGYAGLKLGGVYTVHSCAGEFITTDEPIHGAAGNLSRGAVYANRFELVRNPQRITGPSDPSKRRWKVGDRVRVVYSGPGLLGKEGEVVTVLGYNGCNNVYIDESKGGLYEDQLELVEPAPVPSAPERSIPRKCGLPGCTNPACTAPKLVSVFKPGDRVEVVEALGSGHYLQLGSVHTVASAGRYVHLEGHGDDGWFPHRFRLAKDEPKPVSVQPFNQAIPGSSSLHWLGRKDAQQMAQDLEAAQAMIFRALEQVKLKEHTDTLQPALDLVSNAALKLRALG